MLARQRIDRRRILISGLQAAGLLLLAGCDNLSQSQWFAQFLSKTEGLSRRAQRTLTSKNALPKEYTEAELSPIFPANGETNPNNPIYQTLAQSNFADWKLEIGGLVQSPLASHRTCSTE